MKFTKDSIKNNRRRFLYGAAGTLSALFLWRFNKKEVKEVKKDEPVKMLTEDGQLVEVDPRYLSSISSKGKKIKPEEIHTWVKRSN